MTATAKANYSLNKVFYNQTNTPPKEFEQISPTHWISKDQNGEYSHTATKTETDLTITDIKHQHTATIKNYFNIATIKNYFNIATKTENTYSALNINITQNHPESKQTTNPLDLITNPKHPANIYTGNLKTTTPITIISSQKSDNIFASGHQSIIAHLQDGNDSIYASTKADTIHGGLGNDTIYVDEKHSHWLTDNHNQTQPLMTTIILV